MSFSTAAAPAAHEARDDDDDGDDRLPVLGDAERVQEEAGKGVDADLDQHGGVEQGRDRRRRDAGVREPGVEGDGRRFREHAEQDEQDGRTGDEGPPHGRDVEGVRQAVDLDEPQEHDHGAEEGHQESLVGLDDEIGLAVEPDEPPAADGDDLPEQVDEDQVPGEDQAHHRADEQQDHQIVFALVLLVADVADRIDDDQASDEGGHAGHEDGQGVNDQDEIEPQGQVQAHDLLPPLESEGDQGQRQDGRYGAHQDGPDRPGRPGKQACQGDRE
jgi:hypothetical protein